MLIIFIIKINKLSVFNIVINKNSNIKNHLHLIQIEKIVNHNCHGVHKDGVECLRVLNRKRLNLDVDNIPKSKGQTLKSLSKT